MILCFYKKIFLLILLGFFSAIIIGGSATFCSGIFASTTEPPRAMWVWDIKIFQDEEATQRLLNFCKEKNISTLFYTAYKVTGAVERDYRRFNSQAHKRNILVHALAGDPRWALEKYHHRFLEWAKDVLEFNSKAPLNERFDGIHSDVEPYLLAKPWEADSKSILIQYLEMNRKAKVFIKQSAQAIAFAADVPFWYDDDTAMWVEWRNKFAPANYHILDMLDQIAIMDYRNFAEGANGSIALAAKEVEYAASVNKKVYIGQETKENLYPPYVTFGGMTEENMERQIKKLVEVYINSPGFAGIAMHHYTSYRKLVENK